MSWGGFVLIGSVGSQTVDGPTANCAVIASCCSRRYIIVFRQQITTVFRAAGRTARCARSRINSCRSLSTCNAGPWTPI